MQIELVCNDKVCTGCGACFNICPQKAILMTKNPQGFAYPIINRELCISCGKCDSVCPKVNYPVPNLPITECYAAWADDDVRMQSSSGGLFTLIAEYFLDNNGIVCGATMDDSYNVFHTIIDDIKQLDILKKSKYVQSDTRYIYREILVYLKQDKKVLFTGTPCQVAAARNYFKGYRDNIFYLEILCHGVPSNKMWRDYLEENFFMNQVTSVEFRSKLNGWRAEQLRVFWKDGTSEAIPWPESAYEEGFQRNITLRDGCENCVFSGKQRQGDITIGDFWQVEKYKRELNDGKGTSLLFINNEYGNNIINLVRKKMSHFEKAPLEAAVNNRLNEFFPKHPQAERFKTLYPGHSFSDAVMQCRHSLYDIGLVGLYCVKNFGGQLTQFALYKALTEMGYSVLMIECPDDSRNPAPERPYLFKECPYPDYAMSRHYPNIAEMKFLNKQCKTFITGSDQMFNNNSWNNHSKFMSLRFVNANHRKVAYAASWGHDHIWGEEGDRGEESYYLQKFDFFSVREDSAIKLAKDEFGVDAVHVLDPVFLCPMSEYERMISLFETNVPTDKYLFTYMLDPDREKEQILKKCAAKNKLHIRALLDEDPANPEKKISELWDIDTISNTYIEDLIAHISKSEYVITDSFHGMCLCIILKKEFLAIVNKRRGEARFVSLARKLGLMDRLCYSLKEASEKYDNLNPINYTVVDKLLEYEKAYSSTWLKKAIESPERKKPYSDYDVLDYRIDALWRHADIRCDELGRKIQFILDKLSNME